MYYWESAHLHGQFSKKEYVSKYVILWPALLIKGFSIRILSVWLDRARPAQNTFANKKIIIAELNTKVENLATKLFSDGNHQIVL